MAFDREAFDETLNEMNHELAKILLQKLKDPEGVDGVTMREAISFLKLHDRKVTPPPPKQKPLEEQTFFAKDTEDLLDYQNSLKGG